jgi:glycosyltransferase involved in cell wall biosynthesis
VKVSVVIPTYNREKCVIDLLNCLLKQDYPDFEIVVIDQSEILTQEKNLIIEANQGILKYFKIREKGRSLAKNYGILIAAGEIIIFCDDDIIVPENFISTHVNTYRDQKIGAVSCRLVEDGQPAVSINKPLRTTFYGQLINKPYSTKSGFVTSLNGGNMSFRKDVLDRVGFFEEHFIGTSMVEEPDIAYRILKSGYKLFFNASITVFHFPQVNGNIAEMKVKRADWFYNYLVNVSIFYLKYKRFWNMFFVFIYSFLLSLKHTFKYRLRFRDYIRMMSGFVHGVKWGYQISKSAGKKNRYYTPVRREKKMNEVLHCISK